MTGSFRDILTVGGKSNSLGRTDEVIEHVLADRSRISELYNCCFDEDAWVRMRAMDAIEKICREHPDWLLAYIDRFEDELSSSSQPSIQWHLAQIYSQVELNDEQMDNAIAWMIGLVSSTDVDWIVAANTLKTLMQFAQKGFVAKEDMIKVLKIQQKHKSKSVVRKANVFLAEL